MIVIRLLDIVLVLYSLGLVVTFIVCLIQGVSLKNRSTFVKILAFPITLITGSLFKEDTNKDEH